MSSKKNIKNLQTTDFDYSLPEELIAYAPLEKRDASRLMVIEKSQYKHTHFSELATDLPAKSRLVFNNTKVIAARLFFKTNQEKEIEIFLLEPVNGDYTSLHHNKNATWNCLIGGSKKWNKDETLVHAFPSISETFKLYARCTGRTEDCFVVQFNWDMEISFYEMIALIGNTPLPPYIKRSATAHDVQRYQTVYATSEGSVAAPTAGLHFTDELMDKLRQNQLTSSYVTLHVGAGTFKPVTASSIADHTMHKEFFEISLNTLEVLAEEDQSIIPVGTTSLRTLESVYWIGIKIYHHLQDLGLMNNLDQWEHLDLINHEQFSYQTVFRHLIILMKAKGINTLQGHTGICITPGYPFKVAKGLITNFHQPQSTLLFIIAAMLGNTWKEAYKTAIEEKYRFLSYGDGMLIKL